MSNLQPDAPAALPCCKECGCQTGGGEYCYEHAPYMVWPKKDGSFISDRQGRQRIWPEHPAALVARLRELKEALVAIRPSSSSSASYSIFAHGTAAWHRLIAIVAARAGRPRDEG